MDWLIIPLCLLMTVVLTAVADRALNKPDPPAPPCEHPWFMDGRCIVCGEPR